MRSWSSWSSALVCREASFWFQCSPPASSSFWRPCATMLPRFHRQDRSADGSLDGGVAARRRAPSAEPSLTITKWAAMPALHSSLQLTGHSQHMHGEVASVATAQNRPEQLKPQRRSHFCHFHGTLKSWSTIALGSHPTQSRCAQWHCQDSSSTLPQCNHSDKRIPPFLAVVAPGSRCRSNCSSTLRPLDSRQRPLNHQRSSCCCSRQARSVFSTASVVVVQ